MQGESPDELLERIRGGDVDARRVLLSPEEFSPSVSGLTLEALFAADPAIGELGAYAWARIGAEPSTPLGHLDRHERNWTADLLAFFQSATRDVSREISPQDGMYSITPDSYFGPGASALRNVRLAMLETRTDKCESLLDFACGYGRALRFFRAAFPEARLVACDIVTDAVDFCAKEFGAVPVYSHADPAEIELPGPFDVIWVGSLFSHLPEASAVRFLDLLGSVLSDGGLLLFTVQGHNVRRQILSNEVPNWQLSEADAERIVRDFDERGYGYLDRGGYGTTLCRPSWVVRQIEERPGLRLVGYRETGWGRQDVVTCQAT